MKLSILDLSIVPKNGDRHQALMNTLDLAQQADELGFNRFWVAEHHAAGTAVGRAPEVLIPFLAAKTKNIKVGSGAVLLNHYSPFKVAENFNSMEEMFPGRIDMGIGRATAGPVTDMALQRQRTAYPKNTDDSADQLIELLHWMNQDFDTDNPFSEIKSHNNGTTPEFWLLGSSPWSSRAAAELGLRYAFAGFINPSMSYGIAQNYYNNFRSVAHTSGAAKPKLMLALNVFAAETEQEAHKMTAPFQLFEQRLRTRGDTQSLLEEEDTALRILGSAFQSPQPLLDPKQPPRILASTPDQLNEWLTDIAEVYNTDEIMLQTVTGNHDARLKSQELLASEILKGNKARKLVY